MTNQEILSYIAGYVDGDGCFNLARHRSKNRFKYGAQIIITSVNKPVLQFIASFFSGRISTKKSNDKNRKDIHRYCICASKALAMAKTLLPFLIQRKTEAKYFIEFLETTDKSIKDDLFNSMRVVKKTNDLICVEDVAILKAQSGIEIPKSEDFAYLSGLIDAECCLSINRYKSNARPNFIYKIGLTLNDTKLSCFEFLVKKFKGSVCFMNRKQGKNQLRWNLLSKELSMILDKIVPYLITKKDICKALIQFRTLTLANGGARHTEEFRTAYAANLVARDEVFNHVRYLNQKGQLLI